MTSTHCDVPPDCVVQKDDSPSSAEGQEASREGNHHSKFFSHVVIVLVMHTWKAIRKNLMILGSVSERSNKVQVYFCTMEDSW